MKCANCGEEIEEGMRFCGTCGAPVPQEKACVSCGAKIPLKMKFCPECGAPQDGSRPKAAAAIAMGDKNVIAGDVTGKKEETHISGNATIIKNEDQTKQVKRCHVCGRMVLVTQGFECPSCGEFTCENCYDSASGLCKTCAGKKTSGKTDTYRTAVQEALADGRIDFADRRKLDTLQRELGLAREEALAIEAEEKNAGGAKAAAGGELSTAERLEFESVTEQFYGCTGTEGELLAKARKLYEAHPASEQVLGLYLPVLAATEGGAAKAMGIIKSLPVDVLAAYMTAADICLAQDDLVQTENYVNRAKTIWQDDPLVLCREAYLSLAFFKQYGRQEFLDKADAIAQNVGALQLQDKLAKSHRARLAALVAQAKGGDVPAMDADYCKQNGLYFRIAGNGKASVKAEAAHAPQSAAPAQAAAPAGNNFSVSLVSFDPTHKIGLIKVVRSILDLDLGPAKQLVEGKLPAILKAGLSKAEADKIIADIVAAGGKASVNAASAQQVAGIADADPLKLAIQNAKDGDKIPVQPGTYRIDFAIDKGIIIEGSETEKNIVFEFDESIPITASAVFRGVKFICKAAVLSEKNMIDVSGIAKPQFVGCSFEKCGISVRGNARPSIQSCDISGAYKGSIAVTERASVDCKNTTTHDGGCISLTHKEQEPVQQSVFNGDDFRGTDVCIRGVYANPEFSNVSVHEGLVGFNIFLSAKGIYRGCKAYNNGANGFLLEKCGKVTLHGCEAYGNKYAGFQVEAEVADTDVVMEQCKSYNNTEGGGFFFINNCKGTYRNCEAYGNKFSGFTVKDGCACTFTDCKSGTNSFSKTTGGKGFKL